MSDTPRTDSALRHIGQWKVVYVDFARDLERENAELRKQLEQAEARCRLLQVVADEAHSKLREYVRMQEVMMDGRVPPSWRKLADALAATSPASPQAKSTTTNPKKEN